MRHDQATDQACGDTPRSRPSELLFALGTEVFDIAGLGKVLTEKMRGAGLECLAVLHHCLNGEGGISPREALGFGLLAREHGHGHKVFGEVGIDFEHLTRLLHRLFGGGMDSVPFLPEELGGAEKETSTHLPTDDVGPLINEQRQVAVGLHPLGKELTDDGFRGRAHDEWLFERAGWLKLSVFISLEARVSDYSAFLGKALDMVGLLLQEAHRNEKREVGVLVAGLFETAV